MRYQATATVVISTRLDKLPSISIESPTKQFYHLVPVRHPPIHRKRSFGLHDTQMLLTWICLNESSHHDGIVVVMVFFWFVVAISNELDLLKACIRVWMYQR